MRELLACGLADMRPHVMEQRLEEALEFTACLLDGEEARRRHRVVAALRPRSRCWCRTLEESGLVASVDHNDLHPDNVLPGERGPRFYDWGDAVAAHPLAGARLPLQLLRQALPGGESAASFARARDGYLRTVAPERPVEELRPLLDAACRVGTVARTLRWERGFRAAAAAGDDVRDRRAASMEVLASVLDPSPYGRG